MNLLFFHIKHVKNSCGLIFNKSKKSKIVLKLYYENTDVCLFKVQVYLEVVMITMEQNGPWLIQFSQNISTGWQGEFSPVYNNPNTFGTQTSVPIPVVFK